MEIAKELVLTLKQNNKSHVGYGLQKECEALVGHILQNMAKSHLPPLTPKRKNSEDCVRYREAGNQHFVMGEDTDAIECYTFSLAYADSKDLMAYAYANRSAALYRKRMYKECLMDIDAALNCGYPEEKQKKLKERGDKAIEELKRNLEERHNKHLTVDELMSQLYLSENITKVSSDKTLQTNDNTKHVFPIKKALKATADRIDNSFPQTDKDAVKNLMDTKPRYLVEEGSLILTYGSNVEAPAASNGIQIAFSEKFGRHFQATQAFKPGDIITIEDPYATVIYEDRYYTHCHHCLSRCYNLIPCPECPIAQYCSEKCRKLAWKISHQIECPILAVLPNLLNVDKDKIRMLTKIIRLLIMVTETGLKIDKLKADMKKAESNSDCRTAGFTDEGKLDSCSSRSALSLATNMTTRPLIGISAFACISALGSILLATQTNFFQKKYNLDELTDIKKYHDLEFCGSIMFRACVIMSSNCFSVSVQGSIFIILVFIFFTYYVDMYFLQIQQEPGIKSGSGLYITHSLYNHSCAPNTFRHFEGLTMITRALQPIFPGDQVFTSYGAGYAYMSKFERKEKIMQDYFFSCECPACIYDWPTYNGILKNHIGSISKNKPLVDKLKPYKQRLLQNMYDIDAVKNVLSILYKEVTQPCEEIVHAEQYLKSYYLGKFK